MGYHDFFWEISMRSFNFLKNWGGVKDRAKRQMVGFWEVLEVCELRDLGFLGHPFTSCNNRDCEHCILERLDRF